MSRRERGVRKKFCASALTNRSSQGEVDCFISSSLKEGVAEFPPKDEDKITSLRPGEYFGERALLSNNFIRTATIIATKKSKCLILSAEDFFRLMLPVIDTLNTNADRRVLRMVGELSRLTENQMDELVSKLESVTFKQGEVLTAQGEPAKYFYILKAGTIHCCEEGKTFELGVNNFVGSELFNFSKYAVHSVASSAEVQCQRLHQDIWREVFTKKEDMLAKKKQEKRERKKVSSNSIQEVAVLGAGSYGRVSMVRVVGGGDNGQDLVLAMKRISKNHMAKSKEVKHLQNERKILDSLPDHPFVIKLHQTFQDDRYVYLLMDMVHGGELFCLLHTEEGDSGLEEQDSAFYAANVFLCLEHLHNYDVVYRDLKPENLLFDSDGYLKMIDLGLSKVIPFVIRKEDGTEETHTKSYTLCGTPEYLAPEFVLNNGHNEAVDLWALGILIHELMLGYTPFAEHADNMSLMFKKIAQCKTGNNRITFDDEFERQHPDAATIIKQLTRGNPQKRLGMGYNGNRDIRQHAFFKSINWEEMEAKKLKPPFQPHINGPYDCSNFVYEGSKFDVEEAPYKGDPALFMGF